MADYYNLSFREDFRRLGLSYDLFSRTTTLNHERVVQDLFRTLYDHGAIVEKQMLVSFSPTTGHTLPDRYIEGTCPICGYPEARGDQCDNCGNQLDPTRADRARAPGSTALSRSSARQTTSSSTCRSSPTVCATWIESQRDWRPNVKNFSLGLLDEIRPRPITRDLDWGVPHPGSRLRRGRAQAHLRLVRRGDRLPLGLDRVGGDAGRARRLARMVAEPRRRALLLPGQGQHRLPHRDLAGDAARLRRGRRIRRGTRVAPASPQRRRHRVPDDGGEAVLDQPRLLDLRPRLPRPLRRRCAPVLPRRGGTRDAGHRLHLGRVRPPQ